MTRTILRAPVTGPANSRRTLAASFQRAERDGWRHSRLVVPANWPAERPRQGLIVAGVNESPMTGAALAAAFDAAAGNDAELILVHAIGGAGAFHGLCKEAAGTPGYRQARRLVIESLTGWAEKYPEVTFRTQYRLGDAADVLVRYSQVADLVVVGAPRCELAGSLHEVLLDQTACPVLIAGTS